MIKGFIFSEVTQVLTIKDNFMRRKKKKQKKKESDKNIHNTCVLCGSIYKSPIKKSFEKIIHLFQAIFLRSKEKLDK